jgi:hypothetical protein
LEFCSRDTETARITDMHGGSVEEVTVTSAYFLYNSDEPPPMTKLRDNIDYCCTRKKATHNWM